MRWIFYRLLLFAIASALASSPLLAQPDETADAADPRGEPAVVDADSLNFDRPNNLVTGTGNVVIQYKGARLTAEKARFNTETHEAWAEGNVRLHRANEEWKAPALYYNFDSRAVQISDAHGFVDGFLLNAEQITQPSTNHYAFARSTVTTCDYEHPHYRLQATHGEFWPNDRVVLYNVTARLGDVPVFWWPVISLSTNGEDAPVRVALGHSSQLGFFALTSTGWRMNGDRRFTVHLDGYTERGMGVGGDFSYKPGTDGMGLLKGYYVHDGNPNDDDDDRDGKDNPNNRYRIQLQHRQTFESDLTLRWDVNKWSDSDITDDFFDDEYRDNREPQTVIDLTKTGTIYTLSLQARPQVNDFQAEVERLPEAKLAVNRTRLGNTPFFYEGETSAGYYRNEPTANYLVSDVSLPPFTGHSTRFDTFHQVLIPHTFWGWLSVTPRAGARYTYYGTGPETVPGTDPVELRREVFNAGVETSFKLSRTWSDVRNKTLGINGLRHIIQPFADYQWIPTPGLAPDELYQFDTVRSVTLGSGDSLPLSRWVPLEFPAYNAIDSIDRQNVLRFGVRQALQTQRRNRNWDLVEVEAWTDWNIEQNAGDNTFSDIYGTLRLRPAEWLSLSGFTRYDPHDGEWEELNSSLNVGDEEHWSVGVGTRYLRDDSNLVIVHAATKICRNWSIQTYQRVDMEDGQWEEQEYSLLQETHDWYINYGVRYRNQRTRSDELIGFVSVVLKAVPGVRIGIN